MEIVIDIAPEGGMAIAHCSGVFGIEHARKGATLLWNNRDWSGESVVWDFREAEFDLSSLDIHDVARFVSLNQPEVPPARVAFVAQVDLKFGLARMFEAFRHDPRTDVRVFRDYDEAVSWAASTRPKED